MDRSWLVEKKWAGQTHVQSGVGIMKKTRGSGIGFKMFFVVLVQAMVISSLFAQDGLQQARDLITLNQPQEAKTILMNLLKSNPSDDQALFTLGRMYLRLHNIDSSIVLFEKAVSLKNDSANYHFWLGQGYGMKAMNSNFLKQAGLAKKIRKEYEKAVELNPRHFQARVQLAQYYLMAPSFMGGSNEKACEQINTVIPINQFLGRLLLAQYYVKVNKDSSAEKEYLFLMKLYGDSAQATHLHNTYGYFLLQRKRAPEAVAVFEKQVALNPKSANAYDSLGDGYKAAGRLNEAVSAYRTALEIDPHLTVSKRNLAEVEKQIAKTKQNM
jgi:tetratricopeptide (TPR) repeat protein